MNKIRRNIPNAITCGNLLCGCLAIVKAFEGDLVWAAYLVGIAAVLDFFDGFMARLLNVSSPIGKDLDSLADMVTFGIVPGVVMYMMIHFSINTTALLPVYTRYYFQNNWSYLAFVIPIFSAIRLAKFNNDTRQTDSFIGLPTPANAVFFCSLSTLPKVIISTSLYSDMFLGLLCVVFSFLLIAPIPLFALKFKSFGWKGNEIRFVFLILSLLLLITFQFVGIPLVIVLYILMSVINNFLTKNKVPLTK